MRLSLIEDGQKNVNTCQALLPIQNLKSLSLMANDRTQRIAASLVFTVPSKVRDEVLNQNLNLLVRPAKRPLVSRHNQNLLIGLQFTHSEQICIKGRTHCACSSNAIVSTRVSSSTYSQ